MKKHLLLLFLFFTSSVFAEELILKVKNSPCIAGWIYQNGSLENSYCLYEKNHIILASSLLMYQMQNPILHVFKEGEKDIISVHFSLSNKTFISLDESGILTERSFANAKYSKKKTCARKT